MDRNKILFGIHEEDVVTFTDKHTFCISQFRDIIFASISDIQNKYTNSLKEQGFPIATGFYETVTSFRRKPDSEWFDSGAECKMLRLGEKGWKKGKIRIRVDVEFVPDNEENSDEIDESDLDEIRNSIESN
jgi:hypothetical protein